MALLVSLGGWFGIRLAEAIMGFAVLAAAVGVLGGPSLRLIITFCKVGSVIVFFPSRADLAPVLPPRFSRG